MSPTGRIEVFLNVVGQPELDTTTVAKLIWTLLPGEVGVESDDAYEGQHQYWSYFDTGVEVEWIYRQVRSAHLFVQEGQGYQACSQPLFNEFPNVSTRAQIVAALGEPDRTGTSGGGWIRYDYEFNTLHFSLDENGYTDLVTVGVPV